MGDARIVLKLPTRRKRERRSTITQVFELGKHQVALELPPGEAWPLLMFPYFRLPAEYDSGRPYVRGIDVVGMRAISLGDAGPEAVRSRLGADAIWARGQFQPVAFALMLAKIGYGWAVATYGLEAIATVHVLPAIRGQRDDIGRWVGNPEVTRLDGEKGLHLLECGPFANGQLVARVKLFNGLSAPEYFVIVGQMTEAWREVNQPAELRR